MEFLTVSDYKLINKLNKEPDTDIQFAIKAANAFITRWLNFSDSPSTIEVNANRDKYFIDPSVSAVTGVFTLEGNAISNKYFYLGDGILIFNEIPNPGYYKVIAVTTTFGSEVPDDLKMAVSLYVDYLVKKDYRESKTFGGETTQFTTKTTGIPSHIRSMLELYRNY